jgi:hypothetical protein
MVNMLSHRPWAPGVLPPAVPSTQVDMSCPRPLERLETCAWNRDGCKGYPNTEAP